MPGRLLFFQHGLPDGIGPSDNAGSADYSCGLAALGWGHGKRHRQHTAEGGCATR
jgi:hypothetical protein